MLILKSLEVLEINMGNLHLKDLKKCIIYSWEQSVVMKPALYVTELLRSIVNHVQKQALNSIMANAILNVRLQHPTSAPIPYLIRD